MDDILMPLHAVMLTKRESDATLSKEEDGLPSIVPTKDDDSCLVFSPFRLPIAYLPETKRHALSDIVVSDLELDRTAAPTKSSSNKSMYDVLFQPTTIFGKDMIQHWKRWYSSDPQFLKDTQDVVRTLPPKSKDVDDRGMLDIWMETKESASDYFLEKYCFVEWDLLKFMNKSPAILQVLSVANMMSPAISLVMPFLFLLFPFLILKLRGIPITFSVYKSVLQDVARNHFIGKALTNLSSVSLENIVYFFVMTGLYFWQIYQNVLACQRFYNNMFRINAHLMSVKEHVICTIQEMQQFVDAYATTKPTYKEFCEDVCKHKRHLERMALDLETVTPMTTITAKATSIGYLLQRYYELHTNPDYEHGLLYSFGFHGFLDNVRGVRKHMDGGVVRAAKFLQRGSTRLEQQVYPALLTLSASASKNDCRLDQNMILTGPNASGKTTFLKTTSINIIFTQQVGCGFYTKCQLRPYTHIHSYLNIPDTSERDSLFQAESRRCLEILDAIHSSVTTSHSHHFCIFDELYSGTNPTEATQAGYAFLKYLNDFENVDYILTTHYVTMCKRFKKTRGEKHGRHSERSVRNVKMDVFENEDGSLTFTYCLKPGISKVRGAIHVLEEMGYPWPILDTIRNSP